MQESAHADQCLCGCEEMYTVSQQASDGTMRGKCAAYKRPWPLVGETEHVEWAVKRKGA